MARKGISSIQAKERKLPLVALRDQVAFPGVITTLLVTREATHSALESAMIGDQLVFCVLQRTRSVEHPAKSDLHEIGCVCEVLHVTPLPDGSSRAVLRGKHRARLIDAFPELVTVEMVVSSASDLESTALKRVIVEKFTELVDQHSQIPAESLETVLTATSDDAAGDIVAHFLPKSAAEKQSLLEQLDLADRLKLLLQFVQQELDVVQVEQQVRAGLERDLDKNRREFLLKEQLRVIQRELQTDDMFERAIADIQIRLNACDLPNSARATLQAEINRLATSERDSAEAQSIRNYLDIALNLPWNSRADAKIDLVQAKALLDKRHYGIAPVKEAVVEFLAVQSLRGAQKGSALLFVGPPGVGKTSVAQSVATAMGRPAVNIALGGLQDVAELRGHRRTYVASRVGRVLSAFAEAKVKNPVVILDEIDKIHTGANGDPASALLEILDFEQNQQFMDHFLEIGFDLSEVVFIATANWVDPIPAALLDRLEVIEFSGYSDSERTQIARDFLIPSTLDDAGLGDRKPVFTDEAIQLLANRYVRESGVRGLQRMASKLSRKLAVEVALGREIPPIINTREVELHLGPAPTDGSGQFSAQIGVSHGLVVTPFGGDRMLIEVSLTKPLGTEPKLTLTGALGPVMQESVQTALTCVRRLLDAKQVDTRFDVHVHLPQAAIPKDGPSAGVTLACALYSAFVGKPISGSVAMTGEITLRGKLLPIGGLREKILAAKRYGYAKVIFPHCQESEALRLPQEVREGIDLVPCNDLETALGVVVDHAQTVSIL